MDPTYDQAEAFDRRLIEQYGADELLSALRALHANWPANPWRAQKSQELFAELDRRVCRGDAPGPWRRGGIQIGSGNVQINRF